MRNVTRTCIEKARDASLLNELADGRVCERLEALQSQKPAAVNITYKQPEVEFHNTEWKKLNRGGCLGNVKFIHMNQGNKCPEDNTHLNQGARYYNGIFTTDKFSHSKEMLSIKLPGYCKKLSLIQENIWVPIRDDKKILIFSRQGYQINTIELEGRPTCVEETTSGDIVIACSTGMYAIHKDSFRSTKIVVGNFSDMCCNGDQIFAWEYQRKQVIKFVKVVDQWKTVKTISAVWIPNGCIGDTIIFRHCEKNNVKEKIFIASPIHHTIYEVFICLFGVFTSLSTLYRSYHDG